jgi:hypothetical protein
VASGSAGCGETKEERAREIVDAYSRARDKGNFGRVCELFSPQLQLEQAPAEPCPAALQRQAAAVSGEIETEIVDVRVNQGRAVAEIDVSRDSEPPSRQTVLLARQEGEWKITGLQ